MTASASKAVSRILSEEERLGQQTTNRIRYIFAAVYLVGALAVARTTFQLVINPLIFLAYLSITFTQTVVNRKCGAAARGRMQLVSIAFDFLLVTGLLLVYQYSEAPGNFAYSLKNIMVAAYFPVLALTALQFRRSAVGLGLTLALVLYFGLLAAGLLTDMPLTQDWSEFVLGDAVVLPAVAVIIPGSLICVAVVIIYLLGRSNDMLRRIGVSESEKRSLARYFSPEIAEQISQRVDAPRFGGRQQAVVLFCDIRSFTRISEQMDPEAIASFLGEFRDRMLRAIFTNGGTLDKFIGDAVMATFGTPVPATDVSINCAEAVRASLAMLEELKKLNEQWSPAGGKPLKMGIGIHAGEVFAGSIGSEDRLEYTCIGDTVNVASRLEALSKTLSAPIVVSETVAKAVENRIESTYVDRLQVRGRDEPIAVYTLDQRVS